MVESSSFLYVEDDPGSQQVMELIMSKTMKVGNLVIFTDSHDFMVRLKALSPLPDVILLDVHIEPHDGFTMLNMIRADSDLDSARVVALTASVMNEEVEALRAKGFNGAISKPLSLTHFPHLIERIISGEAVWHIA